MNRGIGKSESKPPYSLRSVSVENAAEKMSIDSCLRFSDRVRILKLSLYEIVHTDNHLPVFI